MNKLLSGNNWAVIRGSVYQIGTETVPLPSAKHGPEVMGTLYDHWVNTSDVAALEPGVIASIAFQPAPRGLARQAQARGGGDMLDLDDDVDRLIIELNYSFTFNSSYPRVDGVMRDTYNGITDLVRNYTDAGVLPQAYLPLFSNDAFYAQNYWGRLRPEKASLARRVQWEVDPEGLFRTRTGGWKP